MAKITRKSLEEFAKAMAACEAADECILTREEMQSYSAGRDTTATYFGDSVHDSISHTLAGIGDDLFTMEVKRGDDFTYTSVVTSMQEEKLNMPPIQIGRFCEEPPSSGGWDDCSGGYCDPSGGYCDSPDHLNDNKKKSDDKKGTAFDMNKSLAYLRDHAKNKSGHRCAGAIMDALEAGGYHGKRVTSAHQLDDDYLQKADYAEISKDNYIPQAGDIVVYDPVQGHPDGHAAMYGGKGFGWMSDFKQRDMPGGSAYRKENVSYHIYRRK